MRPLRLIWTVRSKGQTGIKASKSQKDLEVFLLICSFSHAILYFYCKGVQVE